jgi:hypothetical protein
VRLRPVAGRAFRAPLVLVVLAAVLSLSLAGCGIGAKAPAVPSPSTSPTPFLSGAATVTAGQVETALRAVGITAGASPVPFRPAESPALTAAPRLVLKATLPGADSQGFIVIYDFPDASHAYSGGAEMAAYLASGPGRIQFSPDAQHVIRQVGSTVVFYTWSTSEPPTSGAADVAVALQSLGLEIPIVR